MSARLNPTNYLKLAYIGPARRCYSFKCGILYLLTSALKRSGLKPVEKVSFTFSSICLICMKHDPYLITIKYQINRENSHAITSRNSARSSHNTHHDKRCQPTYEFIDDTYMLVYLYLIISDRICNW